VHLGHRAASQSPTLPQTKSSRESILGGLQFKVIVVGASIIEEPLNLSLSLIDVTLSLNTAREKEEEK